MNGIKLKQKNTDPIFCCVPKAIRESDIRPSEKNR
jgi:hypothetical protein